MHPPRFLFLHVNKRCNLRCQHCGYWKQDDNDKPNYLPWPRKAEILREFSALSPGGRVVICGGESMLALEDYFAITGECRRLGLRALSVVNGTRIQNAAMAERMIGKGPHEISVSLNSHREAQHDETRGVAGSFRRAVNALRLLLAARARLGATDSRIYVMGLVYDDNYQDLNAFYNFVLNDIGADKLKLNFLQPSFGASGPVDEFFAQHYRVDPQRLVSIIGQCDAKYRLGLNPAWLGQVGMYFRSLGAGRELHRGWAAPTGTAEHICNTYERNIMVDLYGVARLCFSPVFPGFQLRQSGDLRTFWEQSDFIRAQMRRCNRLCGISHSVRRENGTLKPVSTAPRSAAAQAGQRPESLIR